MILSKKYKEEINKIVMNDDMKKRILQNVLAANENDNSSEKNMKVKTTIPKVKKCNNFKRNMQMVAACFAMVLCLSVVKNYPMLFKHAPNDLEQKETAKSHEDENNDLKNSDDNEFVYSKDSKEIPNDNNKVDKALDKNNNYNNGDGYVKVESNISSKIEREEKEKDNSQYNLSSEVEKNPTDTEPKTTSGGRMQNKISENNTDNSVSITSVVAEEDVNYSQEYKTLDEAEKALNLKVDPLKTLPKGFKMESISVISNEIIQVEYNDGNSNIVFRAGKGIDNISGDYNTYQVKNTAKANGINVNFEGNKSREYNLAVWKKDGILYSISAKNGIDEKTILDMIL